MNIGSGSLLFGNDSGHIVSLYNGLRYGKGTARRGAVCRLSNLRTGLLRVRHSRFHEPLIIAAGGFFQLQFPVNQPSVAIVR